MVLSVQMPSASSTGLNNKGSKQKPRGRAGSEVGGFMGSVMSRLGLLRVTKWLQEFQASLLDTTTQSSEKAILQSEEAFLETP